MNHTLSHEFFRKLAGSASPEALDELFTELNNELESLGDPETAEANVVEALSKHILMLRALATHCGTAALGAPAHTKSVLVASSARAAEGAARLGAVRLLASDVRAARRRKNDHPEPPQLPSGIGRAEASLLDVGARHAD